MSLCFDSARDIDIHKSSTSSTKERAIAGRTSGKCREGDTITWQATHFGVTQELTVRVTKLIAPSYFEDEMVKGAFESMRHIHRFERSGTGTVMKDEFTYGVPFGLIGRLFDFLILKKYMTRFLLERNAFLKQIAEQKSRENNDSEHGLKAVPGDEIGTR